MRRRHFVTGLGGMALAWPLCASAQPAGKIARVAALFNGPPEPEKPNVEMLIGGLEQLGYVDGRNIVLELRYGNSEIAKFSDIIREMIARKPDILLLQGSQAIWAGKKATSTIPIVMVSVADPVGQGLVASLSRPGENLTGFSIVTDADVSKRVQLLGEVIPRATRFAYLTNLSNPAMSPIWQSLNEGAKRIGVALLLHDCRTSADLDAALAAIGRQRPDAVLAEADALISTSRKQIIEFLLREKLPSMWASPFGATAGGLMSYGANFTYNWRSAGRYIDKILKGARPRDLPIEQPMRLELVINQKTARQLGVTIPQSVLLRADRVIE